jgi:serine/threonine-protein kinase
VVASPPSDAAVPIAASVPLTPPAPAVTDPNQPRLVSGTQLVGQRAEEALYEAGLLRPKRSRLLWLLIGAAALATVIGLFAMRHPSPEGAAAIVPAATGSVPAALPPAALPTPSVIPDAAAAVAPSPKENPQAATPTPVETNPPEATPPPRERDKPIERVEKPKDRPKPKERVIRDKPRDRDVEPPPKETVDSSPGWVSLDSEPYATIYIDGKKVGVTPLARIPLSPGTHRVKAVSSQGGEQIYNVNIESSKEARGKKFVW